MQIKKHVTPVLGIRAIYINHTQLFQPGKKAPIIRNPIKKTELTYQCDVSGESPRARKNILSSKSRGILWITIGQTRKESEGGAVTDAFSRSRFPGWAISSRTSLERSREMARRRGRKGGGCMYYSEWRAFVQAWKTRGWMDGTSRAVPKIAKIKTHSSFGEEKAHMPLGALFFLIWSLCDRKTGLLEDLWGRPSPALGMMSSFFHTFTVFFQIPGELV